MVSNMKELRNLLVGDWTLVATIVSVDETEGTSIIQTESGNKLKVKGVAVEAGNKALIKNGIVISPAPNVTFYEFEV